MSPEAVDPWAVHQALRRGDARPALETFAALGVDVAAMEKTPGRPDPDCNHCMMASYKAKRPAACTDHAADRIRLTAPAMDQLAAAYVGHPNEGEIRALCDLVTDVVQPERRSEDARELRARGVQWPDELVATWTEQDEKAARWAAFWEVFWERDRQVFDTPLRFGMAKVGAWFGMSAHQFTGWLVEQEVFRRCDGPQPELHGRRLPRAVYVDGGLFEVVWETTNGHRHPTVYATLAGTGFVAALHQARGVPKVAKATA